MKLNIRDKIVIRGRHIMIAAGVISLISCGGLVWLYFNGANVSVGSVLTALACGGALLYFAKERRGSDL